MHLATLCSCSGIRFVAVVDQTAGRYWPVNELLPGFDGDMVDLIAYLADDEAAPLPTCEGQPLGDLRFLAPIDRPRRNLFCVGKNYREHVTEFADSGYDSSARQGELAPDAPIFFTKATGTVIGPGAPIPLYPDVSAEVDYEGELAVVIGRAGRSIPREQAMAHVFGYTLINDVSARDVQRRHRQWFLGKSLDGFCPMGPVLATADSIDPTRLTLCCHVNGQRRQQAAVAQLIFDIPALIETLSAAMTLQPGDVIATGTPAGVGLGQQPPVFLKVGDRVRIEVEGIGVLENPVGDAP